MNESPEAAEALDLKAEAVLQQELKNVLEGEPPYDIFVRWKSLTDQPIGWEPCLNDGVLANIRPFRLAADVGKKGAGILRVRVGAMRDRDPGTDPGRDDFPWLWSWRENPNDFIGGSTFDGKRWNHLHYSRAFKMAARRKKGLA